MRGDVVISLIFNTPASIAAAQHLLQSPPLAYTPFVAASPMRAVNSAPVLQVRVEEPNRLSMGEEEVLLPMLESFSTIGSYFDLQSLRKLDEATRMLCCQAIMLHAGVIESVMPV